MALAKDRSTPRRDGVQFEFPVKAGVKVYGGAIVVLGSDGYAKPGVTGTGLVVLGIAEAPVDNTDGQDGDVTVAVRRGMFRFENSSAGDAIALTEIGQACYLVDDQTVAKTSGTGTRSVAGVVADVTADGVWVDCTLETAVVAALAAGLDAHGADIDTLDGRLDAHDTTIGGHTASIDTLDGRLDAHDTTVASLGTAVGLPYTDENSLATRVTALEAI